MQVFVNQDVIDLKDEATLLELLEQLCLESKPIAVAIGSQIVARASWPVTRLTAGAAITVITICKGG